jgi:hypothetical protein
MVSQITVFVLRSTIHTPTFLGLSTLANAGLLIKHIITLSYICPLFTFLPQTTDSTVGSTDALNEDGISLQIGSRSHLHHPTILRLEFQLVSHTFGIVPLRLSSYSFTLHVWRTLL